MSDAEWSGGAVKLFSGLHLRSLSDLYAVIARPRFVICMALK
jgi:hypothetical protein